MPVLKFRPWILALTILTITGNARNSSSNPENFLPDNASKDKEEIQHLIREILKWADSKNSIDLLPILSKDSIYYGFDLDKHKQNLKKLKETNFFSAEFIEDYNQIIFTLDQKLRSGEYGKWKVGNLPPFAFTNDVNPWCSCQDNYNWDAVEVTIRKLNEYIGELSWHWGTSQNPNDFEYRFRVIKEGQIWKVAYMQGFNIGTAIRKNE